MYKSNLKTIAKLRNYLKNITRTGQVSVGQQVIPKVVLAEDLQVGKQYYGFVVTSIEPVHEFNLQLISLEHVSTKAQYVHLYRDDPNNVFSVNFRTTPFDSYGKPHILEHTVLCGSKKFPVRDPFFKMLNRSLATFMNAMTGPDYTMYPFSTTNPKDFRNLQTIYLDAVFNPLLKRSDFMQEGWRLEHANINDPFSELTVKGIVYNEMKGAFADNERILGEKLLNLILPDHTYGHISGGDPLQIPYMTWEDLKDFHRKYYHPSNCHFFSYGNFPLLPTLDFLDSEYLKQYNKIDVRYTEVPRQPRWNKPKIVGIAGRYDAMSSTDISKQNTIAISYLMTDITNIYRTFVVEFISELLMKGPNSPFYKALIEPNFSGGYSPISGFDNQSKDTIFTLGLQGVSRDDFERVVDTFDVTIDNVVKNGFDPEQIETILHGYELSMKHEASNFGLRLLFAISSLLNHNGSILDTLRVNDLIKKLRNDMAENPRFLQNTVDACFCKNTHRLILTMSPDVEYEKKMKLAEEQLLKNIISRLREADKKQIFELGIQLQEEQNAQQPTYLLPTLKLEDIKNEIPDIKYVAENFAQIPVHLFEAPTNGITYMKMVLSMNALTDLDHIMLVPLFNQVITKLGTTNYNFREYDTLINKKTSGLSFNLHVNENLNDFEKYEQGILLSSYCLDGNVPDMFKIWNELFLTRKFENLERFEILTKMYLANLTHGIAGSGHIYAMQLANSLILGSAQLLENLSGLNHIKYMKTLIERDSYEGILKKINDMANILFNKDNLRIAVNVLAQQQQKTLNELDRFVEKIPGEPRLFPNKTVYQQNLIFNGIQTVKCQHNIMNLPVFFCAKSVKTVSYTNPKFAKLRVLARLLSAKYLHKIVREKNGAYGGGARLSRSGLFEFYSYRDPNNFKTLEAFDGSYDYLSSNFETITDDDVFEAKLSLFQSIDAPIIPASLGNDLFLHGLTQEMLAQHREHIKQVTKQDLLDVAFDFLGPNAIHSTSKVILGPKIDQFDQQMRPNENWAKELSD